MVLSALQKFPLKKFFLFQGLACLLCLGLAAGLKIDLLIFALGLLAGELYLLFGALILANHQIQRRALAIAINVVRWPIFLLILYPVLKSSEEPTFFWGVLTALVLVSLGYLFTKKKQK